MDLGTRATSSTASLLSDLRAGVAERQASIVREWEGIVAWASANVVASPVGAATITEGYLDTGVPIAGEGAPLVSEFGLMELIAVLGRSPDGGRAYVGRVIECAWRLPTVYAAVLDGKLAAWRAERIADLTRPLSPQAAGFVDRQLVHASGVGWAQLDRLIAEAVFRYDPDQAETDRLAAADGRRFTVEEIDEHGLTRIDALLDAADGHDLNAAIGRRAILRGKLGDSSSLDVRRSAAAGDLARQDLGLDLLIADETTGEVLAESPGRKVVLNVHVTDTSLAGENPVGRWEEAARPVSTTQIREWLQTPGTTVVVRPVIDLADHVPIGSYEIPDRHRTRVVLRDQTCRFPFCGRPATRCDIDHAKPYGEGGPTCPCNEAALCRRHHRAKTHSAWDYEILIPGAYRWTSPHSHEFRVDHHGTHPITDLDRADEPTAGADPPDR